MHAIAPARPSVLKALCGNPGAQAALHRLGAAYLCNTAALCRHMMSWPTPSLPAPSLQMAMAKERLAAVESRVARVTARVIKAQREAETEVHDAEVL